MYFRLVDSSCALPRSFSFRSNYSAGKLHVLSANNIIYTTELLCKIPYLQDRKWSQSIRYMNSKQNISQDCVRVALMFAKSWWKNNEAKPEHGVYCAMFLFITKWNERTGRERERRKQWRQTGEKKKYATRFVAQSVKIKVLWWETINLLLKDYLPYRGCFEKLPT